MLLTHPRLARDGWAWALVLLLQLTAHELGHVIAGGLVGFAFESLQVGPVCLDRSGAGGAPGGRRSSSASGAAPPSSSLEAARCPVMRPYLPLADRSRTSSSPCWPASPSRRCRRPRRLPARHRSPSSATACRWGCSLASRTWSRCPGQARTARASSRRFARQVDPPFAAQLVVRPRSAPPQPAVSGRFRQGLRRDRDRALVGRSSNRTGEVAQAQALSSARSEGGGKRIAQNIANAAALADHRCARASQLPRSHRLDRVVAVARVSVVGFPVLTHSSPFETWW